MLSWTRFRCSRRCEYVWGCSRPSTPKNLVDIDSQLQVMHFSDRLVYDGTFRNQAYDKKNLERFVQQASTRNFVERNAARTEYRGAPPIFHHYSSSEIGTP